MKIKVRQLCIHVKVPCSMLKWKENIYILYELLITTTLKTLMLILKSNWGTRGLMFMTLKYNHAVTQVLLLNHQVSVNKWTKTGGISSFFTDAVNMQYFTFRKCTGDGKSNVQVGSCQENHYNIKQTNNRKTPSNFYRWTKNKRLLVSSCRKQASD